ncbi:SDR family NAD(P)-dependent oxidoreductase [Micromonospora taraxaci]|uniref:NAD(P)-dependent dehydrogenase (Short-subunit alcohol dehydrogenase family) n=1 Tax=Micromonospora taraxaci TaxID=1316803 RepID=A0A561VU78_9ACTN|nr:SDR family NAD(P)-dependent oxidoreductase [Micromonospora taraxaci]TWG15156.1 NAD(P)-dependent dehydrogenase (short-subunit alcohol dehydrogenase family) [Micromonospora taraxaci]
MSGRLDSKVLVVTGGTQGMGLAFAQRAAKEGAHVVIGARDKDRGEEAAAQIRSAGSSALFVPTDVTVEEEMARLVGTAVSEFGRLDGAFNNAGGGPMASVRATESEDWHLSLALNLTSVFYGLKYELPAIIASGGGAIVNNASVSGVKGDGTQAAYNAAKHGVIGLTRSAAHDVARSGVRVNALVTGLIDTPLWQGVVNQAPEIAERYLSAQPTGRAGTSDEVAALTTFLLSDEATFISGASIAIDGALTA